MSLNMESMIIFLLVSIAGSSGFLFVSNQCDHLMSEEYRELMENFPPNGQELKSVCPGLLELMACYDNEVQNTSGKTFQELANSGDQTVAQRATFFNNLLDLIRDVCNEETQLHKNYIDNGQCIKENLLGEIRRCTTEAHRTFDIYKTSSFADEDVHKEARCITKAYELVCGMDGLGSICGETAKDILLEVVRRLQVLKLLECTEKSLVTIRGKFLDFLEQQGKQRDHFATAFEF